MKHLLLLLVVGTMLMSSCSQKFSVQKRKYNKGFYFASAAPKNNTKTKEIVLVKEKIIKQEVNAESILLASAETKKSNEQSSYSLKAYGSKKSKPSVKQTFGFTENFNFIPKLQLVRKAKLEEINKNNNVENKKSGVLDVLFGASMLVNLIYTVLVLVALFIYLSTILTSEQLLILGAIVVVVIVLAGALSKGF